MKAYLQKHQAAGNATLLSYSMSPSDALLQNAISLSAAEMFSGSRTRDADGVGGMNDDMYRRSSATSRKQSDGSYRTSMSLARSLQSKKDKESTIRVVANTKRFSATGSISGSTTLTNIIPPYTKFFLESVSEDRAEKAQIVETFGSFIAFFFGSRPEVYNFGGRLLNAKNHDWKNDFQELYEYFLRGTKCVDNNASVIIQYDDVLAQGFLMNCHLEYQAIAENQCPFSFSMLLTSRAPLNQVQRLRDRKMRSSFSAAEEQLLSSLDTISKSRPNSFAIMQGLLSSKKPLTAADIVLYGSESNTVKPSATSTSTIGAGYDETEPSWESPYGGGSSITGTGIPTTTTKAS